MHIKNAAYKANSDIGVTSKAVKDKWLTSPYCYIEPAMAFQVNLPMLIFREQDVLEDGLFEKGVRNAYLPVFDLTSTDNYFQKEEWKQLLDNWKRDVFVFYEKRRNQSMNEYNIITSTDESTVVAEIAAR